MFRNRKQCFHEFNILLYYLCIYKPLNTIDMKKNLAYGMFTALALVGLLLPSCRTKTVYAPYPNYTNAPQNQIPPNNKVEEELDDCEKESLQMEGDLLRAYGSAIDYDRDFARQSAVANARAQMASDIKALVTNIFKNYRATTTKNNVSTSGADRQQDIISIADEVISRTTITCSKRYRLSDGRYECAVCVSMVQSASEDIEKAVLSEDEKLGVRFDAEQFRKSYKEELEKYRQEKASRL